MIVYRIIFDFYAPNSFKDVRVTDDPDGAILAEIARLHLPTYSKKRTTLQKNAQGVEFPEALEIHRYEEIVLAGYYGAEETVLDTGRRVWFNPVLFEASEYVFDDISFETLTFIR